MAEQSSKKWWVMASIFAAFTLVLVLLYIGGQAQKNQEYVDSRRETKQEVNPIQLKVDVPKDIGGFEPIKKVEDSPQEIELTRENFIAYEPYVPPPPPVDHVAIARARVNEEIRLKLLEEKAALQKAETVATLHEEPQESMDENFSALGTPTSVATYPVPTERIVPIGKALNLVLTTSVHTQLPSSTVEAIVEQDVVGLTGRKVLIPAGSRLLGRYESLKEQGDTRLAVIWTLLSIYNEKTGGTIRVNLESESTDAIGRSGVGGELDNRYQEKYAAAAIITALNTAAQVTIPVDTGNGSTIIAANSLSNNVNAVTNDLLSRSVNIAPVLRIPAGKRINARVTKDLVFKYAKTNLVNVVISEKPSALNVAQGGE